MDGGEGNKVKRVKKNKSKKMKPKNSLPQGNRPRWKPVEIANDILAEMAEKGFVDLEEITDYQITTGKGFTKKQKKRKFDEEKFSDSDEETHKKLRTEEHLTEVKEKAKKKKKKQKNRKTNVENLMETIDEPTESTAAKPAKRVDMSEWRNLFVPPKIIRALRDKNFTNPTPIQVLALPSAIRDRLDIFGAAETGSGKTLAFGVPILTHILRMKKERRDEMMARSTEGEDELPAEERSKKPLYALILTPTRELAIQVKDHLEVAAAYTKIKIACIVGGMAIPKQRRILSKSPEIVVATPGRLWELVQEGNEHLSQLSSIRFFVIDEADRMIEKGHFEELESIIGTINSVNQKRQIFVFSATLTLTHALPERFKKKKRKVVSMNEQQKLEYVMSLLQLEKKPKTIDITRKLGTVQTLVEAQITCNTEEKDYYLYYFLLRYPGRTLVFANSIDCIRRLTSILTLLQCCPLPLHANMHQKQRLKNLDRFKGNPRGLLLATDVAARGLDIPNVEHVIHYQVPRTGEIYVHRSGRTARALNEGLSVMLVGPEDVKFYRRIIQNLNRDQELSVFPTEDAYMSEIKLRVNLARKLDKEQHQKAKKQSNNNWFIRMAKEADLELDDDVKDDLMLDVGDAFEQAGDKRQMTGMKMELTSLLQKKLFPKGLSRCYPTLKGTSFPTYFGDSGKKAIEVAREEKTTKKKKKKVIC